MMADAADSQGAYQVRTIDRLIAVNNHGDDCAEATAGHDKIMDRLAELIQEYGGKHKAKLIITIDYEADHKGLDITITSKAQLPGKPRVKERFFMTRDNRLTLQDPARDSLFPGVNLGRSPNPMGAGARELAGGDA
jgi:hypothetical protein